MPNRLKPTSEMTEEEILAHYGVKGMRWGVIRKKTSNYKKAVDSDTSKLRFVAAKPIRDKISSMLGRNKPPAEIKAERDRHMKSYEDSAKKVEAKGKAKSSKMASERDAHMESYDEHIKEMGVKAKAERGVAAYFTNSPDSAYNQRHAALGERRAQKFEKKAKEIKKEADEQRKSWDEAIAKNDRKTTKQAKEIRDEATEIKKDWDQAITKAEKKHGVQHEFEPIGEKTMTIQLKPISEMSDEEILAHYGVPGMKWGVRKARSARSSASKFKKEIGPAVKKQWKKDMANAHARDVKLLRTMGFKKLAKKVEAQGPPKWEDTPVGKIQKGARKLQKGAKAYKQSVDSDTSKARFVAAKPIRDAVTDSRISKAYNKKAKQILSDPKSTAKFEMGVAAVAGTIGAVGSVALWKYAN
jgi:ribosome-binding protein aMBF1 (putative translation factor)